MTGVDHDFTHRLQAFRNRLVRQARLVLARVGAAGDELRQHHDQRDRHDECKHHHDDELPGCLDRRGMFFGVVFFGHERVPLMREGAHYNGKVNRVKP